VLWEGIESAVRELALSNGEVYVVTGPAFAGTELQSLKGRVLVPTHIFKAIYLPSRNQAGAYFAPNDGSQSWEPISISELSEEDRSRCLSAAQRGRKAERHEPA